MASACIIHVLNPNDCSPIFYFFPSDVWVIVLYQQRFFRKFTKFTTDFHNRADITLGDNGTIRWDLGTLHHMNSEQLKSSSLEKSLKVWLWTLKFTIDSVSIVIYEFSVFFDQMFLAVHTQQMLKLKVKYTISFFFQGWNTLQIDGFYS